MELQKTKRLATRLMKKHGLIDKKWVLVFDKSPTRSGACRYRNKEIVLSSVIVELNSKEIVLDTILHEIAHAMLPASAGHGPRWQKLAKKIGSNGNEFSDENEILPEPKHQYQCSGCNSITRLYRRLGTPASCTDCSPNEFNEKFLLKYI